MAHSPEQVKQYVCENCQVTYAGTPVHQDAGQHSWEAPTECSACGATTFVDISNWVHHHD